MDVSTIRIVAAILAVVAFATIVYRRKSSTTL